MALAIVLLACGLGGGGALIWSYHNSSEQAYQTGVFWLSLYTGGLAAKWLPSRSRY